MGKKNTCKANKVPEEKLKMYDIALQHGDKVERVEVMVTSMDSDFETLKAFKGDELVGEFREWLYYVRIDDEDDTEEYVRRVDEPLPEGWGKVNGQKF